MMDPDELDVISEVFEYAKLRGIRHGSEAAKKGCVPKKFDWHDWRSAPLDQSPCPPTFRWGDKNMTALERFLLECIRSTDWREILQNKTVFLFSGDAHFLQFVACTSEYAYRCGFLVSCEDPQ